MTSFLTHFGCLVLGGIVGFSALAVLAVNRREIVTCKHCKHSKIERHTGDEVLTCWVHSGCGWAVKPDHFCGFGELGEGTES